MPIKMQKLFSCSFLPSPFSLLEEGSSVVHFALYPVQHTRSLAHLWRHKRTLGFARTASDSKVFVFIKEDLRDISKTAVLQVTATAFEEFLWRSVSDELFI